LALQAPICQPYPEQIAGIFRFCALVSSDRCKKGRIASILADAFDLTPSALPAADLLSGLSVGEAVVKRNRSVTTICTHTASLFVKTGTVGHGDLVCLLTRLPRTTLRAR
jgi:hypothetical protein